MSLGADVEPGGAQQQLHALVFPQAQGGLLAAGIEGSQDGLLSLGAGKGQHRTLTHPVVDISLAQGGALLAHMAQTGEPAHQLRVLPSPGESAAVEGVLKALHARLVAVVHGGRAGEGKHQGRPQLQKLLGPAALVRSQAVVGAPLLALVLTALLCPQQGEDAGRVVGAQRVHCGVIGKAGVVFPQSLHGIDKVRRVAAL